MTLRNARIGDVSRKAVWLKFRILYSKIPEECSLRVVLV